jgi:hypothetical protein
VEIRWPSGLVQELRNISSGQTLAVVEPVQLTATGAGSFRFESWPGMKFEIQSSQELSRWGTAAEVTNTTGIFDFTDPTFSAALQSKFYRVQAK